MQTNETLQTLLLLGVLGAGSYFAYRWWQQQQAAGGITTTSTSTTSTGGLTNGGGNGAPPAEWNPPEETKPQPAAPPAYPYGLTAEEFGKLSSPIQKFLSGDRKEVFAATVYYNNNKARLLKWTGNLEEYRSQIAALAKYPKVKRIELATFTQRFAPGRTYAQIVAELTRNIG